jgi:hypothetical protein
MQYFLTFYLLMKIFYIICFLYSYNSLLINLENFETFCLNKDIQKDDLIKISFICLGEIENIVYVSLKNRNDIVYHNLFGDNYTTKGEFETKTKGGVYRLCFESKHKYDTIISFDINTSYESGHVVNIVKDGNYY